MTLRLQPTLLLGLLAALAAPACSTPKGIRVDIDMAGFETTARTLRLTVTAAPDNFVGNAPAVSDPGVAITYTATNDLVMTFDASLGFKFGSKVSFRLATGNTNDLRISAEALAFKGTGAKIASGRVKDVPLSAGGEAEVAIALATDTDSTTVDTTVIDLSMMPADDKVTGPSSSAQPATVAVCDVTGKNSGAVVIGVPGFSSPTTAGAGAVYVVFEGATVDLGASLVHQEFHVYGISEGEQLGAAIGCFDLNNDGADDLVIGAPGAYGANGEPGAGRVYVIRGRFGLADATIDLSKNEADVEWVGTTAGGHLGAQLLAADLQGGKPAEILIAAPGEGTGGVVHVADPSPMLGVPVAPRPLGGTAGHVTFSGIAPQSIAIGDLDGDGTSPGGSEVIFGDTAFLDASNARVGAVTVFANVDPTGTTAFDAGVMGAGGPARRITGMAANDSLGAAVLALNVSGQGADLIVGASGESNGTGAVRIFEHDSQIFTVPQGPKWVIAGAIAGGRFGATLAAGPSAVAAKAPLVVGAPASKSGTNDAAGAVFAYKRLTNGSLPVLLEKISGSAAMDRLGSAIASGSVGTSDDIADVVALAPNATGNPTRPNSGVVYVAITR
jgi:FG-GAP repeat protein